MDEGSQPESTSQSWLWTQVKWLGEYQCWLRDQAQPVIPKRLPGKSIQRLWLPSILRNYLKISSLGSNIRQKIICLANLSRRRTVKSFPTGIVKTGIENDGDIRHQIGLGIVYKITVQLKRWSQDLKKTRMRPNHDGCCQGHTPLPCCPKCSPNQLERIKWTTWIRCMMRGKWKCHLVDHILLVCVWHDNSMVLSPHVALKIVSNSQCPS